ncbi:MAG: hypothetical protein OEM52_02905 [bacterium]|nr:hypothetical protein [bacterium]
MKLWPFTKSDRSIGTSGIKTETDELVAVAEISGTFSSEYSVQAIPGTWEERGKLAWQYYTEEPIVNNAINTWRTFAIGDEIRVTSDDEETRKAAVDFFKKNELNDFIRDMILQLLVKGECMGYKNYGGQKKKTSSGKEGYSEITKIWCLNPVSVQFQLERGEIIKIIQKTEDAVGVTSGNEIELEAAQFFHQKWNSPQFNSRGNSMVLPAFESIELMRDYRRAERAIAKRWTTPLRFISVGGKFGDKVVMPTQGMLNQVRDTINKMDLKTGMVVPFYVEVKTYGTEGIVLNTEEKVKEIKSDIIVSLGFVKSLITGEGPNFATASVGFSKVVLMLKEIKQIARDILNWVFDDWKELNGWQDRNIDFIFSDIDLNNDEGPRKLLLELYDRNIVSKHTVQSKMGLNPDVENSNLETERPNLLRSLSVKDLAVLVQSGIVSVETVQESLGLDPATESQKLKQSDVQSVAALYESIQIPELPE